MTQQQHPENARSGADTPSLPEKYEAAIVALVAEFIGAVTGLRPPLERRLFPPGMEPALMRLCDGLITVIHEHDADISRKVLGQ